MIDQALVEQVDKSLQVRPTRCPLVLTIEEYNVITELLVTNYVPEARLAQETLFDTAGQKPLSYVTSTQERK